MNDFQYFIIFNLVVLALLLFDLKVLHKKDEKISLKKSLWNVLFWVALAVAFNAWIYFNRGPQDALLFLTGYLIEYSLSIDNLFIFYVIFTYFHVKDKHLHKILFWGILGAVLMRGVFIFLGVAILDQFHWMFYIFGLFLIFTGLKLPFHDHTTYAPEKNLAFRLVQKFIPVDHSEANETFFIRKDGKLFATTLFIVLVIIESTDVIFAIDSIPAILGITTDPFLVYSSNIFAILGLRSLFFTLMGVIALFAYLKYGLAFILVFIGVKMLISDFYEIPILWSLVMIFSVLGISILATFLFPPAALKEGMDQKAEDQTDQKGRQ